jgi:methylated-DNA-[protein]-cysteine S-methyltransferase
MPTKLNCQQWKMKSVLGDLWIVGSPEGLKGIYYRKQSHEQIKDLKENKIVQDTVIQLEQYFSGKRKVFDLKLDLEGTEFQKKVWGALLTIPYGTTCSYKDIAVKIKNKKAVRAVGGANGKNPLCVVIPCHRVISADGTLGGYTGGLHIKKKLLQIETT